MFKPWVGDRFGNPDNILAGCRLMILGESHYIHEPERVGTQMPTYTSWIVREYALTRRSPFFNRLAAITLNRDPRKLTDYDADAFWNAVIFYDFVPVLVDGRPFKDGGNNRRPTREMFEAGTEPLKLVLRQHEPQAVIVCGLTLWGWVARNLAGFEGPHRDVVYYDDGRAVFARIRHPSTRNFRVKDWTGRVHVLIDKAAEPRVAGTKEFWRPGI
jgi:hypothetical protein